MTACCGGRRPDKTVAQPIQAAAINYTNCPFQQARRLGWSGPIAATARPASPDGHLLTPGRRTVRSTGQRPLGEAPALHAPTGLGKISADAKRRQSCL